MRGGGHNGGGLGSVDDGIVADLSLLCSVSVDAAASTVRVGGGSTWAAVDAATHEHGFAVPCRVISTTGVGGLTLGRGIGHLTRWYGLTIDNLSVSTASRTRRTSPVEFVQRSLAAKCAVAEEGACPTGWTEAHEQQLTEPLPIAPSYPLFMLRVCAC